MALRRPLQWQTVKSSRSFIGPGASTIKYWPSNHVRDLSSQPRRYSGPSKPSNTPSSPPPDWEDNPNYNISKFADLPHSNFGVNQHIIINDEFKEALRQILWQFRAPIRYAFAYGSGVFPQSKPSVTPSSATSVHPNAPLAVEKAQGGNPKVIDFIFGVSYTQHWHSLNLHQHRDHYSALGSLGSGAVTAVQEKWGAGVYFNPYVKVNGTLIKYGVVNLDTLCTDLSEWTTLYLAGRLHKPVKILRDDPRVRLANQVNLLAALRTALLLLPPSFTEQELYGTIANISYMGDPRMVLPTEDPSKVANIVGNNLPNFRRLYAPLIDNLPNVQFNDSKCSDPEWAADESANVRLVQDMDPIKRGNMVRRLPKAFRSKVYFQYQKKFQIPQLEFNKMLEAASDEDATRINRREGGGFERRIASEPPEDLRAEIRGVIKRTIGWPSTSQSIKSFFTAGIGKSWRYMGEKIANYQKGKRNAAEEAKAAAQKPKEQKDE
ncbi:Phosphatidate cytidylyltransferase, mitochondrial [Lachnellula cervina]|uniref:Phosphatidate cytidylyltransferase, mitochondrial n=1 Tax=Lachnellula cervina TaxID=1316786 RepID=A0A7D8YQP2_9HELO|nr:Phosphatidate cytidylyltransferase, mitochondrial [Lachnellula cervina]